MQERQISNAISRRILDIALPVVIVCSTLPFSLPALEGFFTEDDLMNLYNYCKHPWESLVVANLLVFTSYFRPLGSIFYLVPYYLYGLDPYYFYFIGITVFSINIVLVYFLGLKLTGNRPVTFLATSLFALHPMIHNVLYNYGAIYELTALTALCLSLLSYLRFLEQPSSRIFYWLTLLFILVGLNAKETVVVLPAILLVLEATHSLSSGFGYPGFTQLWKNALSLFKRPVPFQAETAPVRSIDAQKKSVPFSPRSTDTQKKSVPFYPFLPLLPLPPFSGLVDNKKRVSLSLSRPFSRLFTGWLTIKKRVSLSLPHSFSMPHSWKVLADRRCVYPGQDVGGK